MTPVQLNILRQTFDRVESLSGIAALTFYQRLFELDPGLRRLFRNDIEEQGQKLMVALRFLVDSIETRQAIVPTLESLGRRHAGY